MNDSETENQPTSAQDRRRFLKSLTGSLAMLVVGGDTALGRSLLLRPAQETDPSQPCTKTAEETGTLTESSTYTFYMGFQGAGIGGPNHGTELWTGPTSPVT